MATYLALLGADLFTCLFMFFEPIGRVAELMEFDLGLGSQDPWFREVPMDEMEWS